MTPGQIALAFIVTAVVVTVVISLLDTGKRKAWPEAEAEVKRRLSWMWISWPVRWPAAWAVARWATRRRRHDTHLVGYKWATLRQEHDGRLSFRPYTVKKCHYGVTEKAECKYDHAGIGEHSVPDERCRCGFYALKSPWLLGRIPGGYRYRSLRDTAALVLLRVDLSGKVIEGHYGYRAEWQRVEQVAFARQCTHLSEAGTCRAPAIGFMVWWREGPIGPACAEHANPELTLTELANRLGTEVTWQPA